jgi:hypothetical protein
MATTPPTWHRFAWQGIQLDVPEDWNPSILEGTEKDGYCRLDDDEDVRLQIRWGTSRKTQPPSRLVDSYLKGKGDRHSRKSAQKSRARRDTRLVNLSGANTECFEAPETPFEFGMAIQCKQCSRYALVSMLSEKGRVGRALARRVFGSYCDEPRGDLVPWSVYGFCFETPSRFSLSDHAVKAGRLEFAFHSSGERLRAIRFSLAETILRDNSLLDWVQEDRAKALTVWNMKWRQEDSSVVHAVGHRKGIIGLVRRKARTWCRAWHVEEANALYIAQGSGLGENAGVFETFADSFGASRI